MLAVLQPVDVAILYFVASDVAQTGQPVKDEASRGACDRLPAEPVSPTRTELSGPGGAVSDMARRVFDAIQNGRVLKPIVRGSPALSEGPWTGHGWCFQAMSSSHGVHEPWPGCCVRGSQAKAAAEGLNRMEGSSRMERNGRSRSK